MRTEYLQLDGGPGDTAKIIHAARLLRSGALVAFPTETVYGLGADARNPEALAKLTKVTGRREGMGHSLLVPSLRHAEEAAGGFSRIAQKLARIYWPGPLTLVLNRAGAELPAILRLPDHPVARAILSHCGFPLATPSAKRAHAPEPVSAEQVRDALDGEVALILDAGPSRQGRPSTVVKVKEDTIDVPREGTITALEVVRAASPTVMFVCTGNTCRSPMAAGFCQMAVSETAKGDGLPFRVLSAGTDARDGDRANPLSIEAMREFHIDITGHRARGLTPGLLDEADWIFTMTAQHRDSILALEPSAADRVKLLSARNEDIPEPGGRSLERYKMIRDKIAHCLRLRDVVRLAKRSGV